MKRYQMATCLVFTAMSAGAAMHGSTSSSLSFGMVAMALWFAASADLKRPDPRPPVMATTVPSDALEATLDGRAKPGDVVTINLDGQMHAQLAFRPGVVAEHLALCPQCKAANWDLDMTAD